MRSTECWSRSLVEEPGAIFFQMKQAGFRFQAAGKAGQLSRRADDTVTRHDDGDGIPSVSSAHRPHRLRLSQLLRQLAIGSGLAKRNGKQLLPHVLLEWRSLHVERD